ncbi:MAG TPA: flippase-like domain-containing protein [Gemmatimonadaceae bacterium]|nr:flippase-like domain-containing protein [Gemmatimonadaceae bacterium]
MTAVSFAAVIGVSVYAVRSGAPEGINLAIPALAHLLAFSAFVVEVVTRSVKLIASAKAVGTYMSFGTALRTSLGGDFAASITPARAGAEPARYLILAQAGMAASDALVVLYLELFLEMISIATVAFLIGMIFDASGTAFVTMVSVVGVYASFVLGVGLLLFLLSRANYGAEPPAWARRLHIHGKRWELVLRWAERIKTTVAAFRKMHYGWASIALLTSIAHVGVRFTILPMLVFAITDAPVPLGPLVVWPLGIIYGAGLLPAPGGGGAVELAFRAALGGTLPAAVFGAALVWWRFYTFYIYIAVGALVAGNTALRAVREVQETEETLEKDP